MFHSKYLTVPETNLYPAAVQKLKVLRLRGCHFCEHALFNDFDFCKYAQKKVSMHRLDMDSEKAFFFCFLLKPEELVSLHWW